MGTRLFAALWSGARRFRQSTAHDQGIGSVVRQGGRGESRVPITGPTLLPHSIYKSARLTAARFRSIAQPAAIFRAHRRAPQARRPLALTAARPPTRLRASLARPREIPHD